MIASNSEEYDTDSVAQLTTIPHDQFQHVGNNTTWQTSSLTDTTRCLFNLFTHESYILQVFSYLSVYDLIPISIASKRTREMVLSSYYLFLPLEEWQTPDSLHSSRHSYFNTYSNSTIAQRVTNLHCPQRRIFPSLTQLSHLLKIMRLLCVLSILWW